MTTLKAEKRDMSVKAKALRRQGKVIANVYGREMKETIPVVLDGNEAERFLKQHAKGSQAILDMNGEKMNVLLKDTTYQPMTRQFENIDFQQLVEGEAVTSSAQIVLLNEEKVAGYLYHALTEVHFKALPSALVDKIEIDVAGMEPETSIHVGDLDLAKNKDVEMITPADTLVLHVAEHAKGAVEESEEEEEATTDAAEA